MNKCRTCSHALSEEIDAALRNGETPRALSARYDLPARTIQEHRKRHLDISRENLSKKGPTSLEDARYLCRILRAQIENRMTAGERASISREFRSAIINLARLENEERERRAEAAAMATARALDQPGVSDMLDRLLSSLSEVSRAEVIQWIQQERHATDPD